MKIWWSSTRLLAESVLKVCREAETFVNFRLWKSPMRDQIVTIAINRNVQFANRCSQRSLWSGAANRVRQALELMATCLVKGLLLQQTQEFTSCLPLVLYQDCRANCRGLHWEAVFCVLLTTASQGLQAPMFVEWMDAAYLRPHSRQGWKPRSLQAQACFEKKCRIWKTLYPMKTVAAALKQEILLR